MNPYYTHQETLIAEMNKLDYSKPVVVLEFGTGDGSASVFKSFAEKYPNLRIESYDSNYKWFIYTANKYSRSNYIFYFAEKWDKIKTWFTEIYDLVFVDSDPGFNSRIEIIDFIKDKSKVIVLHDYDYYNKGIIDDLYYVGKGSFFGDNYGDEFILNGNTVYPGTLVMRNKKLMDHFIRNMLQYVTEKQGIYVEAGANDGIIQSYTYELENIGWHGILIEPSKVAFDKCVMNRPDNTHFNCALVASDDMKEVFGDFHGSLLSSVNGDRLKKRDKTTGEIVKVNSRTLNSILEEQSVKTIDLFSLDVEGYEMEVLKGFDINKYKPKYVIIEVYDKIKDEIFDFMTKSGYIDVYSLTDYNHENHPTWDGTHNDYLFIRS